MNVADSSPASCPSVASSISTVKPRRSAQRWYMRSSTSVQSCASVPPAPGVHFAHRVELVVLAREQRLQLQRTQSGPELVDRLDQLGVESAGVGRLLGQLQEGAGVVQRRAQPVELVEVVGDPAQLPW